MILSLPIHENGICFFIYSFQYSNHVPFWVQSNIYFMLVDVNVNYFE